jgi:hypothetical protein
MSDPHAASADTLANTPPLHRPAGRPRRILLGQFLSNGDCLYATTVARQIKHDYPGCHLTWAIASICRSVIDLNPDVDEVWEIPMERGDIQTGRFNAIWREFRRSAEERHRRGEFDEVVFTQLLPDNMSNYDGTIRSAIFRGYPRPITVPVAPVVRLAPAEVENVRRFAERHRLGERRHVVLFETSPKTHEALMTPEQVLGLSKQLVDAVPGAVVILSSDARSAAGDDRIIDGSVLSLRENAELSKYCTLLAGFSSGITWLCTSDWAKPLPTVQLLKRESVWAPSLVRDFERWRLPTDRIVELADRPPAVVLECLVTAVERGIDAARAGFHDPVPESLASYEFVLSQLWLQRDARGTVRFLLRTWARRWSEPRFVMWHLRAPFVQLPRLLRHIGRRRRSAAEASG